MGLKEKKESDRRRIRVIDKSFQYGALVRILGATVGIAVAAFLISWILNQMISGAKYDPWRKDLPGSLIALIGLPGIAASYLVIRNTHRIAGPIYRLRKSFDRVRDGDLDFVVSFRKGDRFHELAEGFSTMLESIRKRERGHRDRIDSLRADLDNLETQIGPMEGPKTGKDSILRAIRDMRWRLEDGGRDDRDEHSEDK
jgi:methyl-accepting chemotaxis protein